MNISSNITPTTFLKQPDSGPDCLVGVPVEPLLGNRHAPVLNTPLVGRKAKESLRKLGVRELSQSDDEWLKSKSESMDRCGSAAWDAVLYTRKQIERKTETSSKLGVEGLIFCGGRTHCVSCADHFAGKDQKKTLAVAKKWLADGGSCALATFTMWKPTTSVCDFGQWQEQYELILRTHRLFSKKAMDGDFFEDHGVRGWLKRLEVKYTDRGKGIHPHIHIVFFLEGQESRSKHPKEQEQINLMMSEDAYTLWTKCLELAIRKMKKEKIGQKRKLSWLDLRKTEMKEIVQAPYISLIDDRVVRHIKGGVTVEAVRSAKFIAEYVSKEISFSHRKKIGDSLTWAELIAMNMKWSGDAYRWHTLWHKGRRMMDWSQVKVKGKRRSFADHLLDEAEAEAEEFPENDGVPDFYAERLVHNVSHYASVTDYYSDLDRIESGDMEVVGSIYFKRPAIEEDPFYWEKWRKKQRWKVHLAQMVGKFVATENYNRTHQKHRKHHADVIRHIDEIDEVLAFQGIRGAGYRRTG